MLLLLLVAAAFAHDGWSDYYGPVAGREMSGTKAANDMPTVQTLHLNADVFERKLVDGGEVLLPFRDRDVRVRLHEYKVASGTNTGRAFMLEGVDKFARGSLTYIAPHAHVSLRTATDRVTIDPVHAALRDVVGIHEMRDTAGDKSEFVCHAEAGPDGETVQQEARASAGVGGALTFGSERRVLRLALSATAQYAEFVSGTTAANLQAYLDGTSAAMAVAINRVNEVLLNTFATTLEIIDGNEALISRSSGDAISSVNSVPISTMYANDDWILTTHGISPSAFDIGHIFTRSGGGVAVVGSACSANAATRCLGSSGTSSPNNEAFFVDMVAHEMGHQFGARHTFNGVNGNCNDDNRTPSSAIEPGSGTTIMSYTGICGADNILSTSIPQYAWLSFTQMNNVISGQCPAGSVNGGGVEVVARSPDFTVPRQTSFALAIEANTSTVGAALTYSIEESDVGAAAALSAGDVGDNPLFRTFTATPRPYRLIGVGSATGMLTPTTARDIRFRGVAYDNAVLGGHVAVSGEITVTVDTSKGPFAITSPAGDSFAFADTPVDLVWDVAGTDALSADLCVFVADSADLTGGLGRCVGTLPNTGGGTFTVPASTAAGACTVRLQGVAPNFFYAPLALNIAGGGDGLVTDADCPTSCFVAEAVEAAASSIEWIF